MFGVHQDTLYDANVDGLLERSPATWEPAEKAGTESQPLPDNYTMCLDDIAMELGISRHRAYQLLNRALKKCAKWANQHGYRLDDLLPDPRSETDRSNYSAPES
jgi:hypothetical protein